MSHEFTLPEWHRMAQEGAWIPLRIQVNGSSMYPLLRIRQDYVTIRPIEEIREKLQRGDIILFADPSREERYVLHRVWQIREDSVLPWGDNCVQPDGWISLSQVWGKAVLVERGKRKITLDPVKGLRLAKCWHVVGKGYRGAYRILSRAKRLMLKLVRRFRPVD